MSPVLPHTSQPAAAFGCARRVEGAARLRARAEASGTAPPPFVHVCSLS